MVGAEDAVRLAADLVGPDATATPEGSGWDHVAWRVVGPDGQPWIVRWGIAGTADELAAEVRREVAVMRTVRRTLGDLVADAVVVDEAIGCLAYPRVPGTPLQSLLAAGSVPPVDTARVAREAGALMRAVAGITPPAEVATDDGLSAWFADLDPFVTAIEHLLSPAARRAVDRFVRSTSPADPAPDERPLAHNDLGAEHVLVDPDSLTITGLIDWSDAARADPAGDVGRLLRDLGVDHLDAVLDGMQVTGSARGAITARAWAYARCLVLEDLAYAVERRPDLVAFERASLAALFAGT